MNRKMPNHATTCFAIVAGFLPGARGRLSRSEIFFGCGHVRVMLVPRYPGSRRDLLPDCYLAPSACSCAKRKKNAYTVTSYGLLLGALKESPVGEISPKYLCRSSLQLIRSTWYCHPCRPLCEERGISTAGVGDSLTGIARGRRALCKASLGERADRSRARLGQISIRC
jgi:hypothetical protein